MPTYLGIDCGGSTTRTCIVDQDGTVLHRGQSGPGNLASTPQVEIERHIRESLDAAPPTEFVAGCFAGLLTEADRIRAVALVESVTQGSTIAAFPDYRASLAASPDTDIIVISGTGALVASNTSDGVRKSGGGGPLLGDHGSAFDLGRRALAKTVLSPTRAEASPMFWETIVELFGSDEPNQILASVYRSVSPAARVAKLAHVVVMDATRGLDYARQSVDQALAHLAVTTWHHISVFHPKDSTDQTSLNLRLAGGTWEIDEGILIEEFRSQLKALKPRNVELDVNVEKLTVEPVIGATHLARELEQIQISK